MILKSLLDAQPATACAISAPGRGDLSYGLFVELVEDVAAALRSAGLARNDRLAMVLPNGPDMAAGFVAAASAVTAAPLNPAYREDEFHFYMEDLGARALLVEAGVGAAEAAEVATWVSKTGLKTNAGTQALEDAACLVFLENEIHAFAAQHAEYPREKFIDILRKTWRKMSPAAQQAALALDLPPPIAALVRDALA